jgi:alkylhydroperoxidase family enzyme
VRFATKVAKERGHVTEADIKATLDAGFSDAQLVEIVALVAENSFTNFLNEMAKTEIDFPVVRATDMA